MIASNVSTETGIWQFAQECIAKVPVMVIGSGASVPYGLATMKELGERLIADLDASAVAESEGAPWLEFKRKVCGEGLEQALSSVQLSNLLRIEIVRSTWNLIEPQDRGAFSKIAFEGHRHPLSDLFLHLFQSTHNSLNVVTTNYDRLVEYAADIAGYRHYTGLSSGHYRTWSPLSRTVHTQKGNLESFVRTVCVWKVHGSLDWARGDNHELVGLPVGFPLPLSHQPLIVTPGIQKYESTHQDPFRSIISFADDALSKASSYLCVGYGFNDSHIQPKLLERCRNHAVPLVVLARTITSSAKEFLFSHSRKFLALEQLENSTKAYSHDAKEGVVLPEQKMWSLESFVNRILGKE